MSHLTRLDLVITDLGSLEEAAQELGLELVRDQTTFKTYGRFIGDTPLPEGYKVEDFGRCNHLLRVKGDHNAYEVGIVSRKDGSGYDIVFDSWAGGYGLVARIGLGGVKLKQQYGKHAATQAMAKSGFQLAGTTQLANGTLQVTFKSSKISL